MSRNDLGFDSVLHNLSISGKRFLTPEEGIKGLRGKEGQLEAVHIYLDNISPEAYLTLADGTLWDWEVIIQFLSACARRFKMQGLILRR